MNGNRGYFDHNATTPMSAAARAAWLEASERHWHNPSGLYRESGEARRILEDWRAALADHFGIDEPERIVFTSGATEANNAVIRHLAESVAGFLATSEIEHPCVEAAVNLHTPSERVRRLPTDRATGTADLGILRQWIESGEVGAVSLMAANNETGALQPWRAASALCREAGIAFHTDAAQWIGKLPTGGIGAADCVTGSGHKFGGPKGVGFLVVAEGAAGFHGDRGGPQERGRWAGTEQVAGIAAMVAALEACSRHTDEARALRAADRDAAERRLHAEIPGAFVVSGGAPRLWNTLAVVIPGIDGKKLVARLGRAGVAASTGSACSTGTASIPRVLAAIGTPAHGMVRLSGGWQTTAEEWNTAVEALIAASRPAPAPRP